MRAQPELHFIGEVELDLEHTPVVGVQPLV